MKILILEVFDDQNGTVESLGFKVTEKNGDIEYGFTLEDAKYTVLFGKTDVPPSELSEFLSKYKYLEDKSLVDHIEYSELQTEFNIVSVSLSGPQGAESTGLNNFGAVYSRLYVAISDYLNSHTPEMIRFVGYEEKMNLVYNKISAKLFEGPITDSNKYSRVDNQLLMQNGFIKEHTTEALLGNLGQIKKNYNNYLSGVRVNKNADNAKILQKKDVGTLYKSGKSIYMVVDVLDSDSTKYARLAEVYNKNGNVRTNLVKKELPLNPSNIVQPETLKYNMVAQIMAALYEYGDMLINTPAVKKLKMVMDA